MPAREISDQGTALRKEISDQRTALQQVIGDVRDEVSELRQEHLTSRFELLKWSFAFWVGQVIAFAGIVGMMLRLTRG